MYAWTEIRDGHPVTVGHSGEKHRSLYLSLSPQAKQHLQTWIRAYLRPGKSICKGIDSYRLSLLVSLYGNHMYLSNDTVKEAMLKAGYTPVDAHEMNWAFQLDRTCPAALFGADSDLPLDLLLALPGDNIIRFLRDMAMKRPLDECADLQRILYDACELFSYPASEDASVWLKFLETKGVSGDLLKTVDSWLDDYRFCRMQMKLQTPVAWQMKAPRRSHRNPFFGWMRARYMVSGSTDIYELYGDMTLDKSLPVSNDWEVLKWYYLGHLNGEYYGRFVRCYTLYRPDCNLRVL